MYRISKMFGFSASHRLEGLPNNPDGSEHPCTRLHGHNYQVELILSSYVLDEHGFVLDYRAMQPFKDFLNEKLDHRHLNDVIDVHPTAENLARYLYEVAWAMFPMIDLGMFPGSGVSVRVSETDATWAEHHRHE